MRASQTRNYSGRYFVLMYRIVEKQMHSRQKIEIKRLNLQPEKVSLATRAAIKVKCSGNSSTVIGKKQETKHSSKWKRNCTTEKESFTQSHTCLNINIMKSTENQCSTASNNYQDAIHSETANNKTNKTLIEHETASLSKKKNLQFTYTNLKQNPECLVGKIIKHKWDFTTKSMFLKGKIIGITPNEATPDDSDTDILKDETCFEIQYSKYKSKTYHYRILPDLQCGDLKIL